MLTGQMAAIRARNMVPAADKLTLTLLSRQPGEGGYVSAIAHVQDAAIGKGANPSASVTTGAFAANPTVGNTIAVWFWGDVSGTNVATQAGFTITDSAGNAYTIVGFQTDTARRRYVAEAVALVTATAAGLTITVTPPFSAYVNAAAAEFSGVIRKSPARGTIGQAGPVGTAPQPGALAVPRDALILAGVCWNTHQAPTITKPAAFTQPDAAINDQTNDTSTYQPGQALYKIGSTGTENPTWTITNPGSPPTDAWEACQVALASDYSWQACSHPASADDLLIGGAVIGERWKVFELFLESQTVTPKELDQISDGASKWTVKSCETRQNGNEFWCRCLYVGAA